MKKSKLIEELQLSRREIETLLRGLNEEQMTEPGVMNGWSIKDILAHLARWEGEMVTALFQIKQGRRPSRADIESMDEVDRLNADWHQQDRERSLNLIVQDFRGLRKQTLRRVEEFSHQELNDPEQWDWLRGEPLHRWIAIDTFKHERQHAEFIRQWREERGL